MKKSIKIFFVISYFKINNLNEFLKIICNYF